MNENELTTTRDEIRSLPEAALDVQTALFIWVAKMGLDPASLTWGDLKLFFDDDAPS